MTNGQNPQPVGNGQQSLIPPSNGFDGWLRAVEKEVTWIKAKIDTLATKEDIADLKTLIANREASLQRWALGILITVILALAAMIYRSVS